MNTTYMTSRRPQPLRRALPNSAPLGALAAVLLAAPAAFAEQASGDVCMGTLFADANGGQGLNCTSKDVKIAKATNVSQTTCTEGVPFDLTATFEVQLSGGGSNQTRYDVGLYFDIGGDKNHDGARYGTCSLNVIEDDPNLGEPEDPFNPLDTDICGDINTAQNPLYPTITIPGVLCEDTDGDGYLNLPNCTSWRQPGANTECKQATDAFPGTSSKCNCDDSFNVPVLVEPAKATVTITPRVLVIYDVRVQNDSVTRKVDLTKLCDDTFGPIAGKDCPAMVQVMSVANNSCDLDQPLALDPGGEYACSFEREFVAEMPETEVTDRLTATLVDTDNDNATITPSDTATVVVGGAQ